MSAHYVLTRARELIATPEKWTHGALARDAAGEVTYPTAGECWCLMGALMHVGGGDDVERAMDALQARVGGIASFNDSHTHAEVLAKLDEVIHDVA